MQEMGVWETIYAAMSQAFFTLSIGIGSLAIFGSYIGKERSLLGESINIASLDTAHFIIAGLIIFPACFSFGVDPGEGSRPCFCNLAQYLQCYERREDMGFSVLYLYDICSLFYGYRRI
jgi:NSS family neurotransmitter:Na+ symporter